jgi:diadenosine tetraphosphate (Ap4A) HIT family hydrolase
MYDKTNIFARIIRGEIPCNKIYENEHALSFYDINPVATIHTLVIPKGEYIDFYDFVSNACPEEQFGFLSAFRETANILGLKQNFNTLSNSHKPPFFIQTVPHFHLHLIGGEKIKDIVDW